MRSLRSCPFPRSGTRTGTWTKPAARQAQAQTLTPTSRKRVSSWTLSPQKLPMPLWMWEELPHGSRVPPESSDAMFSTLHALPCCLANAQSSVLDLQGNPVILIPPLWQDEPLTLCAPCRRQQAAQAVLPLCGGPPQLRGAVPGQGVPGCHHGHAPVALLLQARRRGAASAAQAPVLCITVPETRCRHLHHYILRGACRLHPSEDSVPAR